MSSAILYGAIVVIWAGVLIPRWLRRSADTVVPDSGTAPVSAPPVSEPVVESAAGPVPGPVSGPPRRERRPAPPPQCDAEHARVIGARRRLLGMLVVLAIGSGVLAEMQLAAWWVIVPPSVMLVGYLLLLREASRADAERRSVPRTRPAAPVPVAADPVAAPVPVPVAEPAPDAQIIDITGRVGEEFYDQYADAKLRAVGD